MITRDGLEQLYRELEVPLYNFALRWVWDQRLTEEVVHDAFVRLWRYRDEVRVETAKSLAFKTVQNLCKNELRKKSLRDKLPLLDWFFEDVCHAPPPEELRALRAALEALPADLREVLTLLEFGDLNYEEAAEVLGIPSGTVASRKNRAVVRLRELMGEKS